MQVFIPNDIAKHATNKYLGVLVAANSPVVINDVPRSSPAGEKIDDTRTEDLDG